VSKRLPNGRWKARFRPPGGKEISKTHDLKRDADEWEAAQRADYARGVWVDQRRGRRPFKEWAEQWRAAQVHHRYNTTAREDSALRTHLLPHFGDRPIAGISRMEVQGWVKQLAGEPSPLAPRSVHSCYVLLATIMRAAVADQMIAVTPCRGINLPEIVDPPVTIPTLAELEAIATGLPASYRRLVPLMAGTGLRQGEALGLLASNVDWLRRTVTVDHQQQTVKGGVRLVPVKRPASNRVIPVGRHTLDVLAAQIAEYPPGSDGRLFRSSTGRPITRGVLNTAWRKATARAAGLEVTPHDARHFYASLLIRQGLSPTVVAARLGHGDGGVTALRTYAHLWPDDEDRTRAAVDDVLLDDPAGSPRSADL